MVRRALLAPRTRTGLAIAMLAATVGTACDGPASAAPQRSTRAAPQTQASSTTQEPPVRLEFELPPEFDARAPGGGTQVLGFQVGYFLPGPVRTPVKLVDVGRDDVAVEGQVGRVSIPRESLPEGTNRVVLRMRTRGPDGFSAWSEPTAVLTMPALPSRAQAQRPARAASGGNERTAGGRQPRRGLSAAQVDPHPRLKAALQSLLPQDLSLEDAVRPFRNVQDLAEAVVLCRQHQLAFDDFRQAVEGPPSRSLRQALTAVRPALDARRAIRQAREEARGLVAAAERP